jgi:hypothetical protein
LYSKAISQPVSHWNASVSYSVISYSKQEKVRLVVTQGEGRATWRRRQDEARATRSEGDARRRGGGLERRELSALEKEKRNDAPGACSVVLCVYKRKGRGIVKTKGDNPPRSLPARGGSHVPVERRNDQQEREKKKKKKYMHRCWVAEVQKWGLSTVCDVWRRGDATRVTRVGGAMCGKVATRQGRCTAKALRDVCQRRDAWRSRDAWRGGDATEA